MLRGLGMDVKGPLATS